MPRVRRRHDRLPSPSATSAGLAAFAGLVALTNLCSCAPDPGGASYLELEGARYAEVLTIACEVLREEGLDPESVDERTGRIESSPRFAPSLFEPWGFGEVTAAEAVEGTFAFERRRARVEFMPVAVSVAPASAPTGSVPTGSVDAGAPLVGPILPGADRTGPADLAEALAMAEVGALEMRVTVSVERQFRPGKQSSPYTRALGGFARDTTVADEPGTPRDRSVWTPVARDERLERALVEAIARRVSAADAAR